MREAWVLDPESGELLDAAVYWRRKVRRSSRCRTGSPYVITDWRPDQAVVSPVDGSLLTSRADVREHNERNDCVDVGNDPICRPDRPPPKEPELEGVEEIVSGVLKGDIAPEPAERVSEEDVSWTATH